MISLTNVLIFLYDFVVPLLTDSFTGLINAPCVDGFETKSQQIKSKSSSTVTVLPLLASFTEPTPLEEIPTVQPASKSSLRMFPAGVLSTSTLPITSLPFQYTSLMICEVFFSSTTEDSGWSNSPNALFSLISLPLYFSTSLSKIERG